MLGKPSPRNRASDWWYGRGQRAKIAMAVIIGLILLAVCILALSVISRLLRPESAPETIPSVVPTPTSASPTGSETPPTLAPTNTPAPTTTTAPVPTAEPTPVAEVNDSQGDVGAYDSGDQVEGAPGGVDVRAASVEPDLGVTLQPSEGVPAELTGWATEDEILLWITLYEPIPDAPAEAREWLFALDLDGDVETGRPAGSARINPDLGMEVAVALYYDPANDLYNTYTLVWDADQGSWVAGPEARYYLDESRAVVGLALTLEALTDAAAENTGVTVVPEAARGRAAALAGVGEQRIIDFHPDLPD